MWTAQLIQARIDTLLAEVSQICAKYCQTEGSDSGFEFLDIPMCVYEKMKLSCPKSYLIYVALKPNLT